MPAIVLMVAEKPSLALAIAGHLSRGSHTTRHGGATDVHEYSGSFRGSPATFRVTSVKGHVYTLTFTPEWESWDVDPALLFGAETVKVPTSGAVCGHLEHEAKGASHLVLWLDCDREGENICFEVMHKCCPVMAPGPGQRVWRARFSAVSEAAMQGAMRELGTPDEQQASAVDARQELDLKVGIAFSRFQTRHFAARYPRLGRNTISYGP
jgi:DNA topoisomerase-3